MINKEKFKWIAVFTALILLFAGVITYLAIAIGNKPVEVKTEGQDVSAAAEDNPMVMLTMGCCTRASLSREIFYTTFCAMKNTQAHINAEMKSWTIYIRQSYPSSYSKRSEQGLKRTDTANVVLKRRIC